MATAVKFPIDVAIRDLLMNSNQRPPAPAEAKGLTLPEPVFPRFPDRLKGPGPETPPEKRKCGAKDVYGPLSAQLRWQGNDVATAGLIENWIDETERRR
jgi:hypothetical protein